MVFEHILYADNYTKKIADVIAKDHNLKAEFLKIHNPVFNRWSSRSKKHRFEGCLLPSSSMLIGGNRWRHHYTLDLTDLPIIVIDAHTDMSYDEMILLKLVRPYNWLYFRLLNGLDAHLILPYDSFAWGRWDIVVPEKYADKFYIYAFDRKRSTGKVSLSIRRSKILKIRDPEKSLPIREVNKQISLDWDIAREIQEEKVVRLMARILREGDICDLWLDEGKRGRRKNLKDHIRSCSKIFELDGA